jgi:spectinomycin phosphotransferase
VPWIRGREGYPGGLDAGGWTALGALLGRAHAADVPPELRERLPQEDYRPPWAAAQRAVRLPPTARPADAPTEELREIWREVGTTLALLAERAEALGRELRARRPPLVLCHADPHLMNVLVDGGGQPWLIDWDDARMAPRECDLMFVVGGLFADQPVGARELAWFGRGYGDTRVDPALLAYYRCSRALEDIAGPAVEVLDPRRSRAERAASLANARFSLAPGGILTLALEALGTLERSLSKD